MDRAAALTVVALWGLNFIAAKLSLADMPPFLVTAFRFIGVAVLLVPFCRPRRDQLPGLFGVALVLGIGHFGLLYAGMSGVDAGTSAVLIQLGVPFSVLLSWAVFKDRPDARTWAGVGLAFGGVVLLAGGAASGSAVSFALIAAAMLMWATANILIKRLGAISAFVLNGWMALMSAPMMILLSAVTETGQWAAMRAAGPAAWGGVAFTVVGSSVVAYTLWLGLLRRHPVSRVVPFTLLGPVIGFVAGVLVLGEAVTTIKVIGGLLTTAGVAVVELRRRVPEG